MDKKTAFEIINGLADMAQKSGKLTLGDSVNVWNMLEFVNVHLTEPQTQTADGEIGGGGIKNPPTTP